MRWRCSSPARSSMAQNQKLRCITSRGVRSMPSHVPYICLVAPDVVEPVEQARPPSRCRPPTGRCFRSGKRTGELASTASRRPRTSPTRRTARRWCRTARPTTWSAPLDDEPDVQAHDGPGLRARGDERIPVAGVQRRQAEPLRAARGTSPRGSPRAALARISAAPTSGSSSHGSCSGMMRPG